LKLVVFDLDQTLVDAVAIHDRAATAVFRHFFGVDGGLLKVEYAGRSLIENFISVARYNGIPEERVLEKAPAMLDHYDRDFMANFPDDCPECILPGAVELLGALKDSGNILALYTGDSRLVAETMLEKTGLGRFFEYRFYGTEVKRRPDMISLAVEEVRKATGKKFNGRDIVVVGDSVKDIEAGKEHRAKTVAVATGAYSETELNRQRPDYVFKSMKDWRRVLEAITG
jgi:phosphoglycolate phosphatase-like HAD superfamily hydrolase